LLLLLLLLMLLAEAAGVVLAWGHPGGRLGCSSGWTNRYATGTRSLQTHACTRQPIYNTPLELCATHLLRLDFCAPLPPRSLTISQASFSMMDRAPQLKISADAAVVTGEKGYSMARATHGKRAPQVVVAAVGGWWW